MTPSLVGSIIIVALVWILVVWTLARFLDVLFADEW